MGKGGISFDRDGNYVEALDDLEREQASKVPDFRNQTEEKAKEEAEKGPEEMNLNLPQRNLYVCFKSFPSFEKLTSSVMWNQSEPAFSYRSQFPVLMTPEVIDKLEKFTFVVEVWDEVSPGRSDLVGLVKIPLSSFVYSIRTTEDDIYSLNFLAEQYNMYPLTINDEYLPIYSPRHGQNVGTLKVLLALGTPSQVNRQIQKESELERARMQATLAMEKSKIQTQILQNMQGGNTEYHKEQREKEM